MPQDAVPSHRPSSCRSLITTERDLLAVASKRSANARAVGIMRHHVSTRLPEVLGLRLRNRVRGGSVRMDVS